MLLCISFSLLVPTWCMERKCIFLAAEQRPQHLWINTSRGSECVLLRLRFVEVQLAVILFRFEDSDGEVTGEGKGFAGCCAAEGDGVRRRGSSHSILVSGEYELYAVCSSCGSEFSFVLDFPRLLGFSRPCYTVVALESSLLLAP